MPTGAWGQGSTAAYARLEVAGTDLMKQRVTPVDLEPIRWRDEVGAVGELTFCVEDTTSARHDLPGGAEVNLWVDGTRVFGGGTLIRRRFERGPARSRLIRCTALSSDAWLDWRIVPRWSSRIDLGNRIRKLGTDRAMVKDLIERRGGPLQATNSTVQETNTSMDVVRMAGELSVRDVLDRIADEAREDGGAARRYHVDDSLRVHWYQFPEGPTAPYRLSDASYIREVIDTSGLVEFWPLREESGLTCYGSQGVTNITRVGTWTLGVTNIGVVNERSHRASTLDGTNDWGYARSSSLQPGDTFSVEFWAKRADAHTSEAFVSVEGGWNVRIDSSGQLALYNDTTADKAVTSSHPTGWHHIVITHAPASTLIYVDGVAQTTSGTVRTYSSGGGELRIGALGGTLEAFQPGAFQDDAFQIGTPTMPMAVTMQHLAFYSTQLSAATVLSHYETATSVSPEGLWLEDDWGDAIQSVYVRGKNAAGSGWVAEGGPFDLGRIQAFLEREHADTVRERNRAGRSYIRRHGRVRAGGFGTMEAGAWRAGQVVYVTDGPLELTDEGMLLASVSGTLSDTGLEYEMDLGSVRRRLLRQIRRRRRRRR